MVEKILAIVLELKMDMGKVASKVEIDGTGVEEIFPIKSKEDMDRFLDESQGDFQKRRFGLYQLLRCTLTDDRKKFSQGLIDNLFDSAYIKQSRWPGPG